MLSHDEMRAMHFCKTAMEVMLCPWSSFSAQIPLLYILPWNSKRIRDEESLLPSILLHSQQWARSPLCLSPSSVDLPPLPASPCLPTESQVVKGLTSCVSLWTPVPHCLLSDMKQLHHAVCPGPAVHREQVAWAISPPILPSPLPSIARGIRAQYTEALRTGAMMTPSQAPGKSRPSVGTEAMRFPLLLLSTFTYTALGFPLRLSSTRAHPSFRAFGPLPADKEHSGF